MDFIDICSLTNNKTNQKTEKPQSHPKVIGSFEANQLTN